MEFSIEDLYAYADDLLVVCHSLPRLRRAISLIKEWSSARNLNLNATKSGILELMPRRGPTNRYLEIDSLFCGIPVVSNYKYLGMFINPKLTAEEHLEWLNSIFKLSFGTRY